MAAKEMYDYLTTIAPDNNVTLSVAPQKVLPEDVTKKQVVHVGDDGSEERISLSTTPIFYVTLQWENISEADAGTIIDFYHDAAKGNGKAESFKWDHPADGHTYVVRFDSAPKRNWLTAPVHTIKSVRLRVLGRIAD